MAVVGFPNAGKSTLVNRLAGGSEAVTDAEPGVTRDRRALPCEWNGVAFDLIDTGGVDLADSDELARSVQAQAQTAIEEADVIAARRRRPGGARPRRRRARRPAAPFAASRSSSLANKIDRPGDEALGAELQQPRPR